MRSINPNWIPNATLVLRTPLRNGGSKPRVCDFDDCVRRLVKWHPSLHGHTATYSELVASRLGQLIDAPLIRGSLVYVDPDILPSDIREIVHQPFHLGFTYVDGSNFSANDYPDITNGGAIPSAAVHLAWLHMGDQEGHNQFLRKYEFRDSDGEKTPLAEFTLIDQSCMCGTDDWTNRGLGNPSEFYRIPKHMCDVVTYEDVEPVIQKVIELDENDILYCLSHYPEEWAIDSEAINRLAAYLVERRQHLYDILYNNLKFGK